MYMLASLDLGLAMLCAHVGLFLFGYIHPPRGLLGCNHLWDASTWCRFAWCIPFLRPMRCCLPCLLCTTHLAFIASMHSFCMLAYLFMHESLLACVIKPNSYYLMGVHTYLWYMRPRVPFRNFAWQHVLSILQSNGIMDTQSKPTFVLLGHLFFFFFIICLFTLSYA